MNTLGMAEYDLEEVTRESFLDQISKYSRESVLQILDLNQEETSDDTLVETLLVKRIEEVCQIYKEQSQQSKILVKRPKTIITPDGITTNLGQIISSSNKGMDKDLKSATAISEGAKKRHAKNLLQRNEEGEIIYPIFVNNSLKIQNLGVIDYHRQMYHTEKNLFPIGYTSLREHMSLVNPGERTQYVCEILDGGSKPLYKVTPLDDPTNSIIKDSSTGCWIEICKKINDQSNNKRTNVTVSGPERFGLADMNVIRML